MKNTKEQIQIRIKELEDTIASNKKLKLCVRNYIKKFINFYKEGINTMGKVEELEKEVKCFLEDVKELEKNNPNLLDDDRKLYANRVRNIYIAKTTRADSNKNDEDEYVARVLPNGTEIYQRYEFIRQKKGDVSYELDLIRERKYKEKKKQIKKVTKQIEVLKLFVLFMYIDKLPKPKRGRPRKVQVIRPAKK